MKNSFLLLCVFFVQMISAQNFVGSWKGELNVFGNKLPLVFHIEQSGEEFISRFDSPLQGAKGIAIQQTSVKGDSIIFDAKNLGIVYKAKLSGQKIEGDFMQNGMKFPLVLESTKEQFALNRPQTPQPPFDYTNEEVQVKNVYEGNVLAGTLTLPKNVDKKQPVVVFITGSGAQNRNEELFGHQPFLVLADALVRNGIASLRMDDRGVGGSEKGKVGATSLDFAGDIESAVAFLKARGFEHIGLLGHSEGGMIAPIVSTQNASVRFMVLLAAPGISIDELLLQQTTELLTTLSSGLSQQQIETTRQLNNQVFRFIKNYQGTNYKEDVHNFCVEAMTEAYGTQMSNDEILSMAQEKSSEVKNEWFRYFIQFEPRDYLRQVKVPVMALNGSLDRQVSAQENLKGIEQALHEAGNKNFKIKAYEGLNHLFQTAETGMPIEYGLIEETIAPQVMEDIVAWIKSLR